MPGVGRVLAREAPTQLNLFADAVVASVVLTATVRPDEFVPDIATQSRVDRQFHRWLTDQLEAAGFRIIRHTFHPAEIVGPWEREELPDGSVFYRQWPGGA